MSILPYLLAGVACDQGGVWDTEKRQGRKDGVIWSMRSIGGVDGAGELQLVFCCNTRSNHEKWI